MKKIIGLILFFFISFKCIAQQDSKRYTKKAIRTNSKITIDANIDEDAWKTATYFTDFVETRPTFGKKEYNKTEAYLLYDDNAFYIAAYCHENNIDSISKELLGRDMLGVNDYIGILFDTYKDRINGFGYLVTPLGEQFDTKYSSNGEDENWNSVFESKAKIVHDGWITEIKIPYAAIRFVANKNQTWGINIIRRRSKSGQQLFWNPVDPGFGGNFLAQFGDLTEINNIKPPVRLSFSPYVSLNTNSNPIASNASERKTTTLNGGMDIKYGINQAYTLDMTLIPDFSQVQSDNQIQNLGPFEVRFREYRNFFTEGTELFNKGGFFYSRRIGGSPVNKYLTYDTNYDIINNPGETKLINATKVSGRNTKGFAIGVLNALTSSQTATVYDKRVKQNINVETSPLVNYNILVLDQTLKNNSSVSFINTNVMRNGATYDANVSSVLWDFYDKKNVWQTNGKIAMSNLLGYETTGKTSTGYTASLGFGKNGGRFRFWKWHEFADKKYSQRDMGFQNNPNFFDHGLWLNYRWLKPGSWYNSLYVELDTWNSIMVTPWQYQNMGFNMGFGGTTKKLLDFRIGHYFNAEANDFYEARKTGYKFIRPLQFGFGFRINTNQAKKYSLGFSYYTGHRPKTNGFGFSTSLNNQYRFNNHLTISLNNFVDVTGNGKGFAGFDTTGNFTLVGLRQRVESENSLNIKYNFNNVMGIALVARHYWSRVQHNDVKILEQDGQEIILYQKETPVSFYNFMNIDLTYTWQFALGSFITVNWKGITEHEETQRGYFKNLGNTFNAPRNTNFNVRIIYFLDYLNLKKKH